MEKYCNIIDQIPADYFNEIDGFEAGTFLKLKIMRQKFKAKTKLLSTALEKVEHNFKKSSINVENHNQINTIEKSCNPKIQLDTEPIFDIDDMEEEERQQKLKAKQNQIIIGEKFHKPRIQLDSAPDFDIDDMEEEERQMQAEQKEIFGKNILEPKCFMGAPEDDDALIESDMRNNKEIVSKVANTTKCLKLTSLREELVHDLCEDKQPMEKVKETYLKKTISDDDHCSKIIIKDQYSVKNNIYNYISDDDDNESDCELDDLLKDIKEQDNELKGRQSVFNEYAYKDFEEGKRSPKEQPSAQRITFPVDQNERVKTPELDEDGFPVSRFFIFI